MTNNEDARRLARGLRDGTLLLSEKDEAAEQLERLVAENDHQAELIQQALTQLERSVLATPVGMAEWTRNITALRLHVRSRA